MRDISHFDMTPEEESTLNERNARKLFSSEKAWKEVCALAQQHSEDGFFKPVSPYELLKIFNRMKMDHLRIDGKA